MNEIDSLRLSITQQCNLTCPYCHKEGQIESKKELTFDEINTILHHAKKAGIKKIKITGGEPLLRNDIIDIITKAGEYNFKDISIVTNGILLDRYAQDLKKAGLNRINIGCDSLSSNILLKNIKNIEDGLQKAKKAGLAPIKLNMVILKGINDNEIDSMIDFSRNNNVILQLIELININGNEDFYKKHFFDLKNIEKELEKKSLSITTKEMQNRKQYDLGDVIIEIVRPFTNEFCKYCKRIRITSDGKIKSCLMRNDNLIDFKDENSLIETIQKKREEYAQTN